MLIIALYLQLSSTVLNFLKSPKISWSRFCSDCSVNQNLTISFLDLFRLRDAGVRLRVAEERDQHHDEERRRRGSGSNPARFAISSVPVDLELRQIFSMIVKSYIIAGFNF